MRSFLHRIVFAYALLAEAHAKPLHDLRIRRQNARTEINATNDTSPRVDLGYEIYEGYADAQSGLNIFKGIRYAAPPTGALRWQAPQPPATNRSAVLSATQFAPECPQSGLSKGNATTPSNNTDTNEDCLSLSISSPANANNLPVLVYIHGGGYGTGNGQQNLTSIINSNGNNFVGVTIQYRLGAFGFLSSDEVHRFGVVNAGLLDQHFALQWVQSYIHLFGGNAAQVTIAGESAGGGSVMLLDMAYGGTIGDSLFVNSIAASPYLPMQYGYDDWVPSQSYYAFANAAGCGPTTAYGNSSETIFECLVAKDSQTLITASDTVSASGTFGTWGFLPVTDGDLVQELPSQQLLAKKVNGRRLLVGNNADEGPLFVPPNIDTEEELIAWLNLTFPLFSQDDISKVLDYYPGSTAPDDPTAPKYATPGTGPATAINVSEVATGHQQRADNIYAETTFVCPSYWMAEAYSGDGHSSYKYQFSPPVSVHASDLNAYFGPPAVNQGPDLVFAFMNIWGNFITQNNPSIPLAVANGASSNDSTIANPTTDWPQFSTEAPLQINLNQTGGTPFTYIPFTVDNEPVNGYTNPGLQNNFTLANAYTWEGGRGTRCDFWRNMSALVPE